MSDVCSPEISGRLNDALLFDRALRRLGPLSSDQMHGFEPALPLGGQADLQNLRNLDAITHLTLLADLGERKIMRDIAFKEKSGFSKIDKDRALTEHTRLGGQTGNL